MIQTELAEAAGVSVRSIAGYEAGGGTRPNTARKVAAALDIAVEDLLDLAHTGGSYPPTLDLSDEDFAQLVGTLDYEQADELKRGLLDWLESLPGSVLDPRSMEWFHERDRTRPEEALRRARAGSRAVTLHKFCKELEEERLRAVLPKELAAELAPA